MWWCIPIILVLEKQEREDPWCFLAIQTTCPGECQILREILLQIMWRTMERHMTRTSACCMQKCICAPSNMYIHVHTKIHRYLAIINIYLLKRKYIVLWIIKKPIFYNLVEQYYILEGRKQLLFWFLFVISLTHRKGPFIMVKCLPEWRTEAGFLTLP